MAEPPSERADLAAEGARAPRSTIRVPKTAEIVADHVRKRIIRGELKEGGKCFLKQWHAVILGPEVKAGFRTERLTDLSPFSARSIKETRTNAPYLELSPLFIHFVRSCSSVSV